MLKFFGRTKELPLTKLEFISKNGSTINPEEYYLIDINDLYNI